MRVVVSLVLLPSDSKHSIRLVWICRIVDVVVSVTLKMGEGMHVNS